MHGGFEMYCVMREPCHPALVLLYGVLRVIIAITTEHEWTLVSACT